MLTLREPIKLNISDGLPTVSDAFYERISGAYSTMSADVTPKELLFCLSTPFELPDELGGLTTLAVENNFSDRRSVTMALITNVLNRILLSTTPEFTYQDQVYIDSVLYKLGVEDVPLFMKQVQKLSDEHVSVERLVDLYRQELTLRETQTGRGAGETALPARAETREGAEMRERLYLHNAIYDRLQTRELYELVNSFQTDSSRSFASFRQSELKTSEQLSASRLLALSELREKTTELPRVELHHSINRFELGDLLPAPQTAEQVLSQTAEAALLASFEHVFSQRLADRITRTNTWLRLERVLGETVENSVARFQSFHTENSFFFAENGETPPSGERIRTEVRVLRELVETRTALGGVLALSQRLRESAEFPPPALEHPPVEASGEVLLEESETEHTERETEKTVTRDIAALTRSVLERGAAPAPEKPPEVASPAPPELRYRTVREIELQSETERQTERLRETLLLQRIEAAERMSILPGQTGTQTVSETLRELRERSELRETRTDTRETPVLPHLQNAPVPSAESPEGPERSPIFHTTAPESERSAPTAPQAQGGETPAAILERELRESTDRQRERFEALEIEHLHTRDRGAPAEAEGPAPETLRYEAERAQREEQSRGEMLPGKPGSDGKNGEAETPPRDETQTVSETLRELRERSERETAQLRTQETLRETTMQNAPAAPPEPAELPGVSAPVERPAAAQEREMSAPVDVGAGETPAAVLERELREINERNREKYEAIELEHLQTRAPQPSEPNTKKTIEVSKRALEAPEKVLRELRESVETRTGTPTLSAEAQTYLQHADPATRAVLEAAMRHDSGDGSVPGTPGVRQGSMGEFNAAAMEILSQASTDAETAAAQAGQAALPTGMTALPAFTEETRAVTSGQRSSAAPLPKLSLIHRREQESISDELLERLENRSTKNTEQTDVFETQTDRRIEEFNNTGTTTRLTTQSTEDVTELVNRTLARQMDEISDKVYRQMEKRLQTERSRRGRF